MKYIIEITELDDRPEDWTVKTAWPKEGLFICKGDTSLYHVYSYGVNYIAYKDDFVKQPITEQQLTSSISEELFLKVIAAASRAETLK
jgi:hypothetical protein